MRLIKCAGSSPAYACTEVNYLTRDDRQAAGQLLEPGWQQTGAEEFLCLDCTAVTLQQARKAV